MYSIFLSNFVTRYMIETLISSKTRIKLLLKFFLNSKVKSYLRQLESEFGASTNAIRVELNRLEKAGLLNSHFKGNKRFFQANENHPLFVDIHNLIKKYVGIDKIIEEVTRRMGDVQKIYLVGDFASGKNSTLIELVLFGEVNQDYIKHLVKKVGNLVNRTVEYTIMSPTEQDNFYNQYDQESYLLLWKE